MPRTAGVRTDISAVIKYSLEGGVTALWMGDLETDFIGKRSKESLTSPRWTSSSRRTVMAETAGRSQAPAAEDVSVTSSSSASHPASIPTTILGYNTITQNCAGDIIFECEGDAVHVFTSNDYDVDFLDYEEGRWRPGYYYLGTLSVGKARAAGAS